MIDRTLKKYDLFMLYDDLENTNVIDLPHGYSFRFFDGTQKDINHWVDIEVSSGDVLSKAKGFKSFEEYYGDHQEELKDRCFFLLDNERNPIGTSTAFYVVNLMPGLPKIADNPLQLPKKATGHLHWVAIRKEDKGKGLSKPMITKTMKKLHELGHKDGFLHIQTHSWLACKIYLDLGWKPFRFVQSIEDFKTGWDIVYDKISAVNK